ncbi:MAG: hypothetical protein WCT26_00910 [Candidatus Buchananbacteria bacterium]
MPVTIRTGCSSYGTAYACTDCGRLHWSDGTTVFNRGEERAFLNQETGQIFNKPVEAPS